MGPDTYSDDIDKLLALRAVNGADFWATPDGGTANGGPLSTLEAAALLAELGTDPASPELKGAAELIFAGMKADGRIRTFASGSIYPCQTANAARTLCRLGYADDARLQKTYRHLLDAQHEDGGWRCNASKYGKGPETASSNPGPTLTVLDVFRYTPYLNADERLDRAVAFLLDHWTTRKPLGPCRYGIGTQFMKIEFPLVRYNLLNYVYVLSFYDKAKNDARFLEALDTVRSKMVDGMIVIESANRKLKDIRSCAVGEKSELATRHYEEIVANLA